MTKGPQRLRLDAAVDQADETMVSDNGATEWANATWQLSQVVTGLRQAARSGLGIGGRTGPAMFHAMEKSADNLEKRITEYVAGQEALTSAADTIGAIRKKRDQIDTDPATAALPDPGSFSDDPEWDDEQRLTAQGQHNAAVSAFQEREALREQRAREIADEFDQRYEAPIETMKKIHGIPDPERAPGGPAGGDGPGGRTPGGRTPLSHPDRPVQGTGTFVGPDRGDGNGGGDGGDTDPPRHTDPVDPGPETGFPPHDPISIPPRDPATPVPGSITGPTSSGPSSTSGTIGTAVGVGLGGGALLGGLVKGGGLIRSLGAGLVPGTQQTRPLGGLSRSAVSGTLGRGPAAGVPASGRSVGRGGVGAAASAGRAGAAGAAGSARGAAGARGSGGARAGAGAAGAGRSAAAAGRGRSRRGADGPDREFYDDDGSDWLDDEAAPGVLD